MKRKDWLIISGLIVLSLVPLLAGSVRIAELAKGAKISSENARFFSAPIAVTVHIASSCLFGILGALQFSPGLRARRPKWHRLSGRALVVFGLLAALTGLWLTQIFPHLETDGPTLYFVRLMFGLGMAFSIAFAFMAALNRNLSQHGDWMMRGYALGMGAGTQVITHLPWLISGGAMPTGLPRDAAMAAGWLINLVVAEWIIRRK